MENGYWSGLCVAMLVSTLSICHAQTPATVGDFRSIADKIVTESKVFPLLRAANDGQGSPEPTISLLGTSDGTVAKARMGYLLNGTTSLDLTFSGPVSGGTTVFATGRGIGGGVSAGGALRLVLHRKEYQVPASLARLKLIPPTSGVANSAGGVLTARRVTASGYSFDDLVAAALNVAVGIQASGGAALARPAGRSAAVDSFLASPVAVAAAGNTPEALSKELGVSGGPEAFSTAFRFLANDLGLWQVERAIVMSLGASKSKPTFTVADGPEFRTVTKAASTAEFSLGVLVSAKRDAFRKGYYAGLNVSTGRAFAATARNTCLPVGEVGGSQCRNAVLKDPQPDDIEVYQGDVRYFFGDLKFAIGFRPGYDRRAAENTKWSVEVPIMFLQNSKDLQSALSDDKAGLTGGVTVGIKDSPEGPSFFAVFSVGSMFKLPGLPH